MDLDDTFEMGCEGLGVCEGIPGSLVLVLIWKT